MEGNLFCNTTRKNPGLPKGKIDKLKFNHAPTNVKDCGGPLETQASFITTLSIVGDDIIVLGRLVFIQSCNVERFTGKLLYTYIYNLSSKCFHPQPLQHMVGFDACRHIDNRKGTFGTGSAPGL